MPGHYLTVDGMLSGTGIRDSVSGGYIKPRELGLSEILAKQITQWLARYEHAHYDQFTDEKINEVLDLEGIAICKQVQKELPQSKIEYFSNAKMHKNVFI